MADKVLIVDDDETLSAMLSEYLTNHGLVVETASHPVRGLERLRTSRFDVLVLDVMLPDIDGFALLSQVRSDSDIPILMLTARGDDTDRIVGLELGADDYLPKPFNPRELLARLRALIRRERRAVRAEEDTVLRFGRLEIDGRERRVRVNGRPRELTGHQFDLLMALARNAGRIMSRDELMHHVRGVRWEAFDRSIDVHISRIRAAIEDDPKRPERIVTVRGVGYRFTPHDESREAADERG